MGIEISRETEARLIDEARRHGVSVETLLKSLLAEGLERQIAETRPTPELPVWHLGGVSAFHRREIYGDDH